jgi:5'-nucleotidase
MKKHLSEEYRKVFLDALEKKIGKKTIFIDMDGTIANFKKATEDWGVKMGLTGQEFLDKKLYRQEGFFLSLEPIEGAVESIAELRKKFFVRFLSAPSWSVPASFMEKRIWIEKHFGGWTFERMDYSFRKDLSMGHFLVDDRIKYGTEDFIGEHVMFGSEKHKDWKTVTEYLKERA